MQTLQIVLTYATLGTMAIATVEALILFLLRRGDYDWRAYLASAGDALVRQYPISVYLPLNIALPLMGWAWANRAATVPLGTISSFLLVFIGLELCYYWFHRTAHRTRWFWAHHAVHHSSNSFNLAAAYRFGWTGGWAGSSLFFVPLVWLGFRPGVVFTALSLNLLYQFWLHVDWVPKLGPLEWVLNTPSHHRVHHASNARYIDGNYGGVLIVFDRLFGTFKEECAEEPCRYGLVEPLRSNNPVVIAFHGWWGLARDLFKAGSWRDRLILPFVPPDWRSSR